MTVQGGDFWPDIQHFVVVGTKTNDVRTNWPLTSSYQTESGTHPTKSFHSGSNKKVNFDILYTTGASETASVLCFIVECSPDGTNYYRLPNEAVSGGVSTLTDREFQHAGGAGSTSYALSLGLDVFYKKVRVSFKESGVVTNAGSVFCEVTTLGK